MPTLRWEKAVLALGLPRENCRKIETDEEFRLRPDALATAIEQDRAAGLRPFCVTATVGTTSTSSIDPVPAIAAICERHGLWLHVDAAYAGSAAILEEKRQILDGCERADSFVVNPHKWLFVPMDLTAFYCSRPEILRQALSLVPDYLRTNEDPRAVDFMEYSLPLGRRFRALKLWFVMRYFDGRAWRRTCGNISASLKNSLATLMSTSILNAPRRRLFTRVFSSSAAGTNRRTTRRAERAVARRDQRRR